MFRMSYLEKLTYKNNVFGVNSLLAIQPVLDKHVPTALQELRLVHCTTNNSVMALLIAYLLEQDIPLISLGLIDMGIPA